jgi:hypothetical protein
MRPAAISENDRVRLLDRLNSTDPPFRVNTVPLSLKRKRSGTSLEIQENLFEDRLAVMYKVEPKKDWEHLRQYKRFTGKKGIAVDKTSGHAPVLIDGGVVGSESIAKGDFILVSHTITKDLVFDSLLDWKAEVLEVRALDKEHVYVRVNWLNRPEDLEGGRQDHHGKNELVPTNHMDVINAQAVNGTFELTHYDHSENDEQRDAFGTDKYFWRETFELITKSLLVRLKANLVRWDVSTNKLTDFAGHAFMMYLQIMMLDTLALPRRG